ncbi:hypothetical protein SAMN04489760_10451 [Syntrophus gentianae]|uniref:Uncharacterized protein n=1 Tax=Syntrophus gentianae TaxID=43775 RepID=A0A1H7VMD2_9BACT|nr:hypothetical protein [Syntrophus gentianae]SEM09957.1 hypothetical protein SAMN04489760_10451 [Syntrophus gentianae]
MNPRKILLGLLIFLVTGCSLAPSYERPPLPTAAVYPYVSAVEPQAAPEYRLTCRRRGVP